MKLYIKSVVSLAVFLLAVGCIDKLMVLFNEKSDVAILLGFLGIAVDVFFVGWFLKLIWRKKNEESKPSSTVK